MRAEVGALPPLVVVDKDVGIENGCVLFAQHACLEDVKQSLPIVPFSQCVQKDRHMYSKKGAICAAHRYCKVIVVLVEEGFDEVVDDLANLREGKTSTSDNWEVIVINLGLVVLEGKFEIRTEYSRIPQMLQKKSGKIM